MTGRFWLLICLVYGLLFLGLIALNGAVIALAIPLVIYLGAALLSTPEEYQLEATRSLSPDTVTAGTEVTVKVSVQNRGSQTQEYLLEDILPARVEKVSGDTRTLAVLAPGEGVEIEYSVKAGRGGYSFQGVRTTDFDRFGLFQRQATLPARAHFLVMPEVNRLRSIPIQPRRTHGFAGPIPARRAGSGVNFYGVREYQLGDPRRRINWKVTARHFEDLFTNELEQERIADVGLILDARRQCDVNSRKDSLFEYSVQATAALADVFLRDGHRVGLLIYGRGRETTFPGYGKVQRSRILRALARAQTGDNLALESLANLPTRFFPARSQIVLVSPMIPEDYPILIRLIACGYHLMVVSPDPVAFEAKEKNAGKTLELAVRLAHLERVLMLRQLQRAGVKIVDWQVDSSLDQALGLGLGRATRISGLRGG